MNQSLLTDSKQNVNHWIKLLKILTDLELERKKHTDYYPNVTNSNSSFY